MARLLQIASFLVMLLHGYCRAGSPNVPDVREIASAARAVFTARCNECHGAHLPQPEGRFGYVTDLARVASNPEMVIRSSPEESELWELIRREEMPPADASAGSLSEQEKAILHAWIAAGAPAGTEKSAKSPEFSNIQPATRRMRSARAPSAVAAGSWRPKEGERCSAEHRRSRGR